MPLKIANHNRTDTNSYACDDLYGVYIFHKLSSQHSICMSCSDVCKLDSSQFMCNFMFVLCIELHLIVTVDMLVFCPLPHKIQSLVRVRQCKTHFSNFCCPLVYREDKQITGSLCFSLLACNILQLSGCLFSLTGKFHFLNSSYEFMKHTLRIWSPELLD